MMAGWMMVEGGMMEGWTVEEWMVEGQVVEGWCPGPSGPQCAACRPPWPQARTLRLRGSRCLGQGLISQEGGTMSSSGQAKARVRGIGQGSEPRSPREFPSIPQEWTRSECGGSCLTGPPCLPLGQRRAHCLAALEALLSASPARGPSRDAQWTLPTESRDGSGRMLSELLGPSLALQSDLPPQSAVQCSLP